MAAASVTSAPFVRVKYRAPPLVPELNVPLEDNDITAKKKIKPPEIDPFDNGVEFRVKPIVMFPGHTQNKRIEKVIQSDEGTLRSKQYPTVKQRVEITKKWLAQQLHEQKLEAKRQLLKKEWEDKLIQAQQDNEAQKNMTTEEVIALKEQRKKEDAEKEAIKEKEAKEEADKAVEDGENAQREGNNLEDEDERKEREAHAAAFKMEMMIMKEKKILRQRDCRKYHKGVGYSQRTILAFNLLFGYGKRDRDLTEVLPWLLIGGAEASADLHLLLRHGVTHVMNVTTEVPNRHSDGFVYKRIPIQDKETEDAGGRFEESNAFIHRVYEAKGKVYVHCTAGVSRAPTFALAYLVVHRKFTLLDAYTYIQARRPVINLNTKFLYDLALLEYSLGDGCSVLYHKDWRFYDFNLLRATDLDERPNKGLFRTTMNMLAKYIDEDNLLA